MSNKNNYELGSQKAPKKMGGGPGMGRSSQGGETAKDFKTSISKLFNYMKRSKAFVIIAIVLAMCGSILTLFGPDMLSTLTDEVMDGMQSSMIVEQLQENGISVDALIASGMSEEEIAASMGLNAAELSASGFTLEALKNPGIDMDSIVSIVSFLAIIYAVGYIISITQGVMLADVLQKTAKRLRTDILVKINHLPMGYFAKTSKGDVLSRVTNDVDTIGQSLTQSVGTFISAITLLVGSVFMMFITNVPLTITAILSTVIGFVFMMFVMKTSQKYFKRQQKHLGRINGHIEEMYAGHTIVRAYNGEQDATEVFEHTNEKLKDSAFKAQALSGLMMPMMMFIGNFGYVAVCVVGALLALDGQIGFGVIVAFMMYIRYFTQPLSQIAQSVQHLQSAAAASERVFEFLEEEEMTEETNKVLELENVSGNVEFKNVKFGYDDTRIIINDFSAKAKAGQKIAIVGPTGAGKTTVVNLLMRFYEINSGDILIDGVSIYDVKREDVHSQFCMVLQDTWLFEGTLRENLVYSSKNVSEETIYQACKAVGLEHLIRTLPKGLDTMLNDSVNLSQGQKQQLTIARAMIADKPMLILDEATSSVDTRTELQIQKAMDALMSNRTSFVIAHRLSTIKNADLILVMKDGDIIESGNHEDLLSQNGFYSGLYNSQFEQIEE